MLLVVKLVDDWSRDGIERSGSIVDPDTAHYVTKNRYACVVLIPCIRLVVLSDD